MLKRLVNSAQIFYRIIPVGPLLIKSGQVTVGGTDMAFVRTRHRGKDEPFLPGSSLKGVIRSHAERICRTLRANPVPVCMPYLKVEDAKDSLAGQASCGLVFEKMKKDCEIDTIPTTDVYKHSCPVCRMFGSHLFVGRLATDDAYADPDEPFVFEVRDGVAIDRLTGGAFGSAKYDLEVLTKGVFSSTIELINFERWQLGLLGLVLRDMEDELVRMGSGTSRGLGHIRAKVTGFHVSSFGRPMEKLAGIYGMAAGTERDDYGLFPETGPGRKMPEPSKVGLRFVHDITADWKEYLEAAVEDLSAWIQATEWPHNLQAFASRGKGVRP